MPDKKSPKRNTEETFPYSDQDKPFNGATESPVRINEELTNKQINQLIEQACKERDAALERSDNEAQAKNAFKAFWAFAILLAVMFISSLILHILGKPELKIIDNLLIFSQGAITTILGFLFGTKIYKSK